MHITIKMRNLQN